ncbi:SoxR reducing system RseC family protein [Ferriphaselus sp. R-1]|uniref:SoxR reducing system RseC family protein n=1 Tax=Ferriphaselus sp. R-1 TaxID=1485544 RepID=UPI00054DDB9B|nr:SoxR reducing system RseC family protein [Ferriphaselus sp. R-1]
MIETSARVVSVESGVVRIEPTTQSGCGGCKSRSSCGVSGLAKYFSNSRQAIAIRCDVPVELGEELQLRMSEGDLFKAGLFAYLLPSVLALVGAGMVTSFGGGDAAAVVGAVAGFVLAFLLTRVTGWTPSLSAHKSHHST